MLVLTRRVGESIRIDDDITVTVLCVKGNQVRIGIDAPEDVKIMRSELIDRNNEKASRKDTFSRVVNI